MTLDRLLTKNNTSWTLSLLLVAALLMLQLTSLPQRIDYWLYDSLAPGHSPAGAGEVVLVTIDDASLERLGRWPWPRHLHAELVSTLDQAGAETIVFSLLFPEPAPGDTQLTKAMARHGNVILPAHIPRNQPHSPLRVRLPTFQLANAASAIGHAQVRLDSDGLARGLYLWRGKPEPWPALALAAAAHQAPEIATKSSPAQSYVTVPLAAESTGFHRYSAADMLASPPATDALQGKTVFVGVTASGLGGTLSTPLGGEGQALSAVEFHALAYAALVQGRLITPLPEYYGLALAIVIIAVLGMAMPAMRPGPTLAMASGTVFGLLALFYLLAGAGVWVPVASALLMAILAVPLWSGRRLAMANYFLNRQLRELAKGQPFTLPANARRHPPRLLNCLRETLQPQGWWLSANTETLAARHLGNGDIPENLTIGRWTHTGNQSWIRLQREDGIYTLGLLLSNDLGRDATQRYLQRLRLDSTSGPRQSRPRKEHISARIDQVKQATDRMNRLQQFIRLSFEHMPDGILVADELGVIRFANRHIEQWFGEPVPSLAGMPLTRLLEGHDPRETPPWHETVSETLTLGQSSTVDLRIRGKDFLIHFAPFALPEVTQNGIIANISDISELREQQRQHREAVDFISHDVRSPLVSQLALIEQLKRDPARIEPAQLEQLGRLARRSYYLAEEFVQLARAEQLTETRFYDCEFLAVVENARDSVSEQAAEKGIQLVLSGSEDLWLKGNAELLERAVINLLTNAVQYSPPRSVVNIQVFLAGHQACLRVVDEGSGIDEQELPYLFDRYRRQKSSELSGSRGTGLGLSFVNVVVEKHRGEIQVSSKAGEGSAFTLKLPVTNPLATA